ncbi:MAG: lysophospholipid acyltransferase family protein [Halothiobacillaceae bacterium]
MNHDGVWRFDVAYPLLARLPLRWANRLGDRMAGLDARRDQALRTAVGNGLRAVFPDRGTEHAAWIEEYARCRVREAVDAWRMASLSDAEFQSLVRIEGLDQLFQLRAQGQGVLFLMAHYGRLVMLLAALGRLGVRMNMLTMRIDTSNPDLSETQRRFLGRKVTNLRGQIGGQWLSLGDNLRPMYKSLEQGETWIVLLDAYSPEFGAVCDFPFLGGTAHFPGGVRRIAAATGARMVYGAVRDNGTTLNGRIDVLDADPVTAHGEAVACLERDVRAGPGQWWQWNILDYIWTPAHER